MDMNERCFFEDHMMVMDMDMRYVEDFSD